MCAVSAVLETGIDHFRLKPEWNHYNDKLYPTREEFEALRAEFELLKKMIAAAKKYDEDTDQRDCENDDKVRIVKQIAKALDVKLDDVLE